jgi:predicted metal-dependent hydrolase
VTDLEIHRSPRARRWRIELTPEGARLTVPRRTPARDVERIVEANREWVARQLERRRPVLGLERLQLTEREGREFVRRTGSEIAAREADHLGVAVERLQVRDQRTRWGSCSSRGTISLNWRLALASHDVLDYVVAHEVCHLREPNHGPRFWALVESRRPGFREPREWLRRFGHELLAYQPS